MLSSNRDAIHWRMLFSSAENADVVTLSIFGRVIPFLSFHRVRAGSNFISRVLIIKTGPCPGRRACAHASRKNPSMVRTRLVLQDAAQQVPGGLWVQLLPL